MVPESNHCTKQHPIPVPSSTLLHRVPIGWAFIARHTEPTFGPMAFTIVHRDWACWLQTPPSHGFKRPSISGSFLRDSCNHSQCGQQFTDHQDIMSPIHTNSANVASQYHEQQAFTRLPDEGSPSFTPLGPAYIPSKNFESGFEATGGTRYHCGSRQSNEGRLRSPPGHMESQATVALSISSDLNTPSKTVVYNETIDPADQVSFETDVDKLMKAIQQSDQQDEKTIGMARSPAQMLNAEPISGLQSLARLGQRSTPGRTECKPTKKWACNGPNCNKRFSNKTQLDIHRRTHTGLKPYVSIFAICRNERTAWADR